MITELPTAQFFLIHPVCDMSSGETSRTCENVFKLKIIVCQGSHIMSLHHIIYNLLFIHLSSSAYAVVLNSSFVMTYTRSRFKHNARRQRIGGGVCIQDKFEEKTMT